MAAVVHFFYYFCYCRWLPLVLRMWNNGIPNLLFFLFQLRTAREAAKYGAAGSVIGAVSTAAVAWKYSRSPHGTLDSLQ